MTVSIIVFTLNEIDGLKTIMPRIKKEWYAQLIIVDGGSTDGTIEEAIRQGYEIFVQSTPGTCGAFLEALLKCTEEIVVIFAPDGNSVPEDIPKLIEKINGGWDISIGSRYLGEAKSEDDDAVTRFGNWIFTTMFNWLFRTHFKDVLNMYRAYNREKLLSLKPDAKIDSWGTQILARAVRKGYKIIEIPSNEPARIGGERKMQPLKNGLMELKMMWNEFFQ